MFCINCGVEIPDNVEFCPGCGAKAGKLKEKTVFCRNCGEEISENAVVCPKCGAATEKLNESTKTEMPNITINNTNTNTNANVNVNGTARNYPVKSKMVTLILAIFLGYLGIHRFYVGKIGTGVIWLCTFGLCGIGWLADIVLIVIGSFRDKYGHYLG